MNTTSTLIVDITEADISRARMLQRECMPSHPVAEALNRQYGDVDTRWSADYDAAYCAIGAVVLHVYRQPEEARELLRDFDAQRSVSPVTFHFHVM